MTMQAFVSNFKDNSTEAGFQFTFHCDICNEGYKTNFITSKTYKKAGLMRGLGRAASIGGHLAGSLGGVRGGHSVGYAASSGTRGLGERFHGMSPAWHKEHEKAFELAQNEGMGHFTRCPKCHHYVCENDWNEQAGLCTNDAPRVAVEVATARAQKAKQDIYAKAQKTQVFTGQIEKKQTICPQCGKPAGEGKFCNNCGGQIGLLKCSKCGGTNQAGTKFCGQCGNPL